jgi:hypothetical protein
LLVLRTSPTRDERAWASTRPSKLSALAWTFFCFLLLLGLFFLFFFILVKKKKNFSRKNGQLGYLTYLRSFMMEKRNHQSSVSPCEISRSNLPAQFLLLFFFFCLVFVVRASRRNAYPPHVPNDF